jgi:uncharacterized repeat protein (TIGR03803 family)
MNSIKILVSLVGVVAWMFVTPANASVVFTNLFSFSGTNGSEPEGQLLQASDGNLYGTTRETTLEKHGNSGFGIYGHGTVFRITTNGVFTTLASFAPLRDTNANGAYPRAGLIEGNDGNFYGTTTGGGTKGQGTVFKVTTNGILTFLASFVGTNGNAPEAGLLQGEDNTFYGTTATGGLKKIGNPFGDDYGEGLFDNGTVFSMTANGILKTLVFFDGTNGANPYDGLLLGKDGNLYGSTLNDGFDDSFTNNSTHNFTLHGSGTVFKISTDGKLSTLVIFRGTDGRCPSAIKQSSDGDLYGITSDGGATNTANYYESYSWQPYSGFGTVFKISPRGKFSTLILFSGINGKNPNSFILGRDGNFYGTTSGGGAQNLGTIFKMTPSRKLTTLYSFTEGSGSWPSHTTLIQGADGNLYGTTSRRGKNQCGSIFRLNITQN